MELTVRMTLATAEKLAAAGRHAQALVLFDEAIRGGIRSFDIWHSRGILLVEMGQTIEAIDSYKNALSIEPSNPIAYRNLGNALFAQERLPEALISYDRSLHFRPKHPETLYSRGLVLARMSHFREAAESYRSAISIKSDFVEALKALGDVQWSLHQYEDSLESFDSALRIRPSDNIYNNRGVTLRSLRRTHEELESYERAVELNPANIAAWTNRAEALQDLSQIHEALRSIEIALKIDGANTSAWIKRARYLCKAGRFSEAVESLTQAQRIDPQCTAAMYERALIAWRDIGDVASAISDLESIQRLGAQDDYPELPGLLLHFRMQIGDWSDYSTQKDRIIQDVQSGHGAASPFVFQALSSSPQDLQDCAEIFTDRNFPAIPPLKSPPRGNRNVKIRLGYLAAEFKAHATSYLMAGIWELHDRDRFEVIAIENGVSDQSPMRKRLESAFDRFIPIAGLSDWDAAKRIQDEKIDILVNLNGYFGFPRMGIFALRPAGVQVNFLGFPGTLGAGYIDYIIADKIVVPEEERKFFNEEVVYLPRCYQPSDMRREVTDTCPRRADYHLPQDAFVFCNFNQSYKITPDIFSTWLNILKKVPHSVLWLIAWHRELPENLKAQAERQGVEGSRIIFTQFEKSGDNLARLQLADLVLDTLPYNAHTTASDALWAGTPLLTCRGSAFAGRVAASLLLHAGLPELVTETLSEFEAKAVSLATNPASIRTLKEKTKRCRNTASLFDSDGYRRDLEDAYLWMMRRSNRVGRQPLRHGVADEGFAG